MLEQIMPICAYLAMTCMVLGRDTERRRRTRAILSFSNRMQE